MEHLVTWRKRAQALREELDVLVLAFRDPATPRRARFVLGLVIGYAFSPIDFIPDFIPVLGYLDDLIVVPLGIWLARRLIPNEVLERCRQQRRAGAPAPILGRLVAALIVASWIVVLGWLLVTLGAAIGH
jgi:uncharacterized membrane protein YkvA (DUF1232 family)